MKGRSTNTREPRYDVGGKLHTTTIAGVKSGNHSNAKVMEQAKEGNTPWPLAKRAMGGRCGEAEGGAARPRLDRPGRKHGGKVHHERHHEKHHADGGMVQHAPNEPVKEWMKKHGGEVHHRKHHENDHDADDGYAKGGKLTANARKHIAAKNFALPGRRYPIEDASHARNALARVSQHGSPEEKAKVRAAVHHKYPGIGKK